MAQHNEVGLLGEQLALDFLLQKGYTLLERNWRFRRAEVDLIFWDKNVLVFVEVKCRNFKPGENNEPTLTSRKEQHLIAAASAFVEERAHDGEVRFDFIGIQLFSLAPATIKHYPDLFFATEW